MKQLKLTSALRGKNFQAAFRTKYLFAAAILFSLFALSWPFIAVDSQGALTAEDNTNRRGADYKNFDLQPNWTLCRDACANDANCMAYTYVKPAPGANAHCWLKSSAPAATAENCCISGVKSGGGGGDLEINVDRRGSDYRHYELQSADPHQCKKDCVSDPKCRAFTYMGPSHWGPNAHCFLKDSVPSASQNACCISGVIRAGGGGGGGGGQGGGSFAGTWDAYGWDVITIEQNGDRATGQWTGSGGGRFQGVVKGNSLYFSWTSGGNQGEGIMASRGASTGEHGIAYCSGRGCDPAKREGYIGAKKRQ